MHNIETYKRPAFLEDHPPVLARMVLESTGAETAHVAGTVLGRDGAGKLVPWVRACAGVEGILAGDVVVPASGGASVDVYIHCSVRAAGLVFADGVSAEDEQTALAALRALGVYAS